MNKKQKKLFLWWSVGIGTGLFIMFLLLFSNLNRISIASDIVMGHGWGVGNSGSVLTIFSSSFIPDRLLVCEEEYDDCWDSCEADDGEMLFVAPDYDFVYDGDDCYDVCEDNYDTCYDGCWVNNTETYVWNGIRPTNIDSFFETNYPIFYSNVKENCESFVFSGTWISNEEEVGCTDAFMIGWFCDGRGISSALTVCEGVGGTPVCEPDKIVCQI